MSELRTNINTYDIELKDRIVKLRLTVSAQLRLKKKFKQETMETIMSAANDIEMLIAVFDEALSYKDNDNNDLTGEELYDLLVDNGHKGIDRFADILFGIAAESGILSVEQKELVSTGISKTYDAIFKSIARLDSKVDEKMAESVPENTVTPFQRK